MNFVETFSLKIFKYLNLIDEFNRIKYQTII